MNLNDCIVHAINFCLRIPWFVDREQAYRLIKRNYHKHESQIAATKAQAGYKVEDFDDFAVSGDESLYLEFLSQLSCSKDFQMVIVKKAHQLIETHDHVLVLLFNQSGDRGEWNHSLAFIRRPVKTKKMMLILDANLAKEQKIYRYP